MFRIDKAIFFCYNEKKERDAQWQIKSERTLSTKTFLFGNTANKEWILSLYNAINGSAYTNPDDIKLNTIDNVVYMGMKNDVSFLIGNTMNLYEQ